MTSALIDFVIVGAPKCGTTSLYNYLSTNPAVFMPYIKEPHFFSSDLGDLSRVKNFDAYAALFDPAPEGALKGEASATYLFSQAAVGRLMAAAPKAKVIVMMRNPVEAVQSYHKQLLAGLLEDIEDFEEAWRAQDDRREGRRLPKHCPAPPILQYGPTYAFADQLKRVINLVPAEQRHFIIFEEFFAEPAKGYAAVLDFLGAPAQEDMDFRVFNPATRLRSRALARLYLTTPGGVRRASAPIKRLLNRFGIYPSVIFQGLNSIKAPKSELTAQMRAELAAYYADDINQVEALIGRPIPSWRATH